MRVRMTVSGVRSSWAIDREEVRPHPLEVLQSAPRRRSERAASRPSAGPGSSSTYVGGRRPRERRGPDRATASSSRSASATPGRRSAPASSNRRSRSAAVAPRPTNASAATASGELSTWFDAMVGAYAWHERSDERPRRGPRAARGRPRERRSRRRRLIDVVGAGARAAGHAAGAAERETDVELARFPRSAASHETQVNGRSVVGCIGWSSGATGRPRSVAGVAQSLSGRYERDAAPGRKRG